MTDITGKLITISGIDGSGKTTAAGMLSKYLHEFNNKVVILDAMKGGGYTKQLHDCCKSKEEARGVFTPELYNLTCCANLVYTYNSIVLPYLKEGYNVILHRSDLCCRVYSRLFAENDYISQMMIDSLKIHPDVQFYLNVSPGIAHERIMKRNAGMNSELKEKLEYLKRAEVTYQYYLQTYQYRNVVSIDADVSVEKVVDTMFCYINNMR